MDRSEQAAANFYKGYNCAQSVVLAFADLTDMEPETLSRAACSFGGGMGRLREVCGAVSGMFMVCGLLCGYDGPETGAPKAEQYARVQELAHRFEAEHGSIVCRELLGRKREAPTPEARTEAYYAKRPCPQLIADAARILERLLIEEGKLSPEA